MGIALGEVSLPRPGRWPRRRRRSSRARPQGDEPLVALETVDAVRDDAPGGKVGEIMIIDRLRGRPVTATEPIQGTERLLLFGVDVEHWLALGERLATQRVNVAKLLVALDRIDRPSDQLLAQCPAAKTGLLEQRRGVVATDPDPLLKQRTRHLHGIELGPTHPVIGRTAGRVGLNHGIQRRFREGDERARLKHSDAAQFPEPDPPTSQPQTVGRVLGYERQVSGEGRIVHAATIARP